MLQEPKPSYGSPTEVPPTTATSTVPYWIIAAVIAPILLIVIIILLIYWRWKKGAPQKRIEPEKGLKERETVRMVS